MVVAAAVAAGKVAVVGTAFVVAVAAGKVAVVGTAFVVAAVAGKVAVVGTAFVVAVWFVSKRCFVFMSLKGNTY